ncbi:energy transducer TonB [Pigmentibacter ruber]|uniref:energy transducer TonB n=1 Tax=Pigmentibacter ruber TaxID=2683196 RepID=UPI00131E2A15|nr:TonB family protein [Pigmentibacter ruber]BFD32086.1 hypothetical protein GTC16762_17040 [Pigmentibacter ruber]
MEYFFDLNKKAKDENIIVITIYSLFFHFFLVLAIALLKPHPPEFISIKVSTNTIQLSTNKSQSNKQTIQKQQDKKIPKEEIVKSNTAKRSIQKEIPSEKTAPSTNAKDIPNPTPEGQSSNPSKEFYSAESTVDKTAQCTLPEINLTDDATNAGIKSGNVIIEVQINSQGKVTNATLIKGTGYKIDQVALNAAKELNCKPARRDQESVGVIKRINWVIVQ